MTERHQRAEATLDASFFLHFPYGSGENVFTWLCVATRELPYFHSGSFLLNKQHFFGLWIENKSTDAHHGVRILGRQTLGTIECNPFKESNLFRSSVMVFETMLGSKKTNLSITETETKLPTLMKMEIKSANCNGTLIQTQR